MRNSVVIELTDAHKGTSPTIQARRPYMAGLVPEPHSGNDEGSERPLYIQHNFSIFIIQS